MSFTTDNLLFDFSAKQIQVQPARGATLLIQDLVNAIRLAEESPEGIQHPKICDTAGKQDKGGGFLSAITVELVNGWQVKWYAGTYQAYINGGDLIGGVAGIPVALTPGVNCTITNAVNGVLAETGVSGLTAEESAALDVVLAKVIDIFRADFNRRKHDKTANTITLYGDDGVTPYKVFDADDELTEITPQ